MPATHRNLPPAPALLPDTWLTTTEVAAVIRSTPHAVHLMRNEGKGPAYVRRGRNVLYRSDDVRAYLDSLPRTVPGA